MNMLNYTTRQASWQVGLQGKTRNEVLEEMLSTLCTEEFLDVNPDLSAEGIFQALIEREEMRSTAMGSGIAFPHARMNHLNRAFLAVAVLPEPVLFEQEPVQIVCLILAPTADPAVSLKMMAQLSRMLTDEAIRGQILAKKSGDELRELFKHYNPRIDKPILARDIMRMPRFSLEPTDHVSDCSRLMSIRNLHTIPVVDSSKKIIGEVNVDRLFHYGLPDFFSKLKSVSFIAEFDPFEKYFEDERNMLVSEVMTTDTRTVPQDYTILEIVFDLTIKPYTKLYVVDEEGHWVGCIDKGTLLDNVVNY